MSSVDKEYYEYLMSQDKSDLAIEIMNLEMPLNEAKDTADAFYKELKVYKRALELACHYMEYDYPKKNDDIYYRKDRELEMIFINKAKKELEEQYE